MNSVLDITAKWLLGFALIELLAACIFYAYELWI
mgnify:FL=1